MEVTSVGHGFGRQLTLGSSREESERDCMISQGIKRRTGLLAAVGGAIVFLAALFAVLQRVGVLRPPPPGPDVQATRRASADATSVAATVRAAAQATAPAKGGVAQATAAAAAVAWATLPF